MNTLIVIPARYAATRLPGKPLAMIHGKTMIQHVYEKAAAVKNASVIVATEDLRVKTEVELFGGNAMMTSHHHNSGTNRMVEVMQRINADVYVNLQGDEPMCRASDIQILVDAMEKDNTLDSASLYHVITREEAENPNAVKVVLNNYDEAMYFSRSVIPYPRNPIPEVQYCKHVGIYAYTFVSLRAFGKLFTVPAAVSESLEQLNFISAGYNMKMFKVEPTGPAVDTQEDLDAVRELMK